MIRELKKQDPRGYNVKCPFTAAPALKGYGVGRWKRRRQIDGKKPNGLETTPVLMHASKSPRDDMLE